MHYRGCFLCWFLAWLFLEYVERPAPKLKMPKAKNGYFYHDDMVKIFEINRIANQKK